MNFLKKVLLLSIITTLLFGAALAKLEINAGGSYTIEIPQKSNFFIYQNNLTVTSNFTITNNLNQRQLIKITPSKVSGWAVSMSENEFYLNSHQKKTIFYKFLPTYNFDYVNNVVSNNIIVLKKENSLYLGNYYFPFKITGRNNETVYLSYTVTVDKKKKPEIDFNAIFQNKQITPLNKDRVTIIAKNIGGFVQTNIEYKIGNFSKNYQLNFTKTHYINIIEPIIPKFLPGKYKASIKITLPKKNNSFETWNFNNIEYILPLKKLIEKKEEVNNFLTKKIIYNITNNGNIEDSFTATLPLNILDRFIYKVSNSKYTIKDDKLIIDNNLKVNENKIISVKYNYWIIYLILLTIIVIVITYLIKLNENPLILDTKIYNITKVKEEGIKSLKIKIDFKNEKESEIDKIKIIFRMPIYLNIKNNSFTIEPKQVLKSNEEYKLIWEFKRFEKDDNRILAFTLINSKGILGNIILPNLEVEITNKSKTRKYYKTFPIIKN